jgi:hypothetical protein
MIAIPRICEIFPENSRSPPALTVVTALILSSSLCTTRSNEFHCHFPLPSLSLVIIVLISRLWEKLGGDEPVQTSTVVTVHYFDRKKLGSVGGNGGGGGGGREGIRFAETEGVRIAGVSICEVFCPSDGEERV